MLWLRRAAGELLARRQVVAAAGGLHPLPAAASAAVQQCTCGYSNGTTDEQLQQQMQPFSVAMKQLEETVTEQVLPPDVLASNREALASLKDFARSLESPHGYPTASTKNVQFVFRDPFSGGRLQQVRCQLKTTGGNCAQLVQQSLGQLMLRLGLPPHFYFDGEQFQPKAPPRTRLVFHRSNMPAAAPAAEPKAETLEVLRTKAAAAGFPSQTITEEQFLKMEGQSNAARKEKEEVSEEKKSILEKIKKIDPLLQAVAAGPWLAKLQDQDSKEKLQMVKTKVVDEIEAWGWDVRGAIQRVWQGERSLDALQEGKDVGSQLAIQAIVYYAGHNDRKYGGRVTLDPE